MVLLLLGCRAIVDEVSDRIQDKIEERIAEELEGLQDTGTAEAPNETDAEQELASSLATVPPEALDVELEKGIIYAPCPSFSPYDQVGASFHWEFNNIKQVGSVWSWDQQFVGQGEYNGLVVWLVEESGHWYTDGGSEQFHWDRTRAFTCEDDGAHVVYEEGTEMVVSHISASTDYFTEFPERPLLMPREVEVDTSWTVRGVTWPEYPDGRWIHDDSVREHIGRGEEEKETGMGTMVAFRMKMMLSETSYTYYWPMADVGIVVDQNGLAINSFSMPE